MALTKSVSAICDWTALAQDTVVFAGSLDISLNYSTLVHIQAFLDVDNTAHTGTEFIIQGRSSTTDTLEDWYDITRFVGLVNTVQLIQGNEAVAVDEERVDLSENPTTLIPIGTADASLPWVGVEDADALADSEMIVVRDTDADELVALRGTVGATVEYFENAHADTVAFSNVALSQCVVIGIEHYYIRVIVNNSYDVNGATLNFRIRAINVTGL